MFSVLPTACLTLLLTVPVSATSPAARGSNAGIGATKAQIAKAHGVSFIKGGTCSAAPHCFGPRLQNKEGTSYQFTGDSFQDGLLIAYTQNFTSNTTLAEAETQVLRWLPSDSKMSTVAIDHNDGTCAIFTITSPTLAKLFAAHPDIQDSQGIVGSSRSGVGGLQLDDRPIGIHH